MTLPCSQHGVGRGGEGGRDTLERVRNRPESVVGKVGRLQNRNPRVGSATCADPPSLCAGWGRRITLRSSSSRFQFRSSRRNTGTEEPTLYVQVWSLPAGNLGTGAEGAPRTLLSSRSGSPRGKSRRGGGQGASDPLRSRSGSPMVNSGAAGPSGAPQAPIQESLSGKLGRGGGGPFSAPRGSRSGSSRAKKQRGPSESSGTPRDPPPPARKQRDPGLRPRSVTLTG